MEEIEVIVKKAKKLEVVDFDDLHRVQEKLHGKRYMNVLHAIGNCFPFPQVFYHGQDVWYSVNESNVDLVNRYTQRFFQAEVKVGTYFCLQIVREEGDVVLATSSSLEKIS